MVPRQSFAADKHALLLAKILLKVYSYYLYMVTGSLDCVCESKLNIGISIFVVQNFALWEENFEIV
jgi:hypothetical protein